jgi:hypothetical protein
MALLFAAVLPLLVAVVVVHWRVSLDQHWSVTDL